MKILKKIFHCKEQTILLQQMMTFNYGSVKFYDTGPSWPGLGPITTGSAFLLYHALFIGIGEYFATE